MKKIKALFLVGVLCVFSIASTCSATGSFVNSVSNERTEYKQGTFVDADGKVQTIPEGAVGVVEAEESVENLYAKTNAANPEELLKAVGISAEEVGVADKAELKSYSVASLFGVTITAEMKAAVNGGKLTLTVSQPGVKAGAKVIVLQIFHGTAGASASVKATAANQVAARIFNAASTSAVNADALSASAGDGVITFEMAAVDSDILVLTQAADDTNKGNDSVIDNSGNNNGTNDANGTNNGTNDGTNNGANNSTNGGSNTGAPTGDTMNVLTWTIVLAAAVAAVAVVMFQKKKQR